MAAGSGQLGSPQDTITAYAAVRSTVIVALADVDVLTTVIGTPAKAKADLQTLCGSPILLGRGARARPPSQTARAPTETQLDAGCTSAAARVAS